MSKIRIIFCSKNQNARMYAHVHLFVVVLFFVKMIRFAVCGFLHVVYHKGRKPNLSFYDVQF